MGVAMFERLLNHYNVIRFVPNKRYTFRNPFMTRNYPVGFDTEEKFRSELNKFKPIFVANAPLRDEFIIDLDYHIPDYTPKSFESLKFYADKIMERIEYYLPIDDIKYRFSGRGIHVVFYSPILERVEEVSKAKGLLLTNHPKLLLMKYVYKRLYHELGQDRVLRKAFDPTILSTNKIFRTVMSLNDKSFLPVVEFSPDEDITIDKIISCLDDPPLYEVILRKRIPVREHDRVIKNHIVEVDEYEAMRLTLYYNYYISHIKRLE